MAADCGVSVTLRRLVRAILEHQRGVLQDDATVPLARRPATARAQAGRSIRSRRSALIVK